MDEQAPVTWFVNQVSSFVETGANTGAAALANAITPLVAVCFGIYIIVVCFNYMRGNEDQPIVDFLWRIFSLGIVILLGLNASNYTETIIPIAKTLGSDLAGIVTGGDASSTVSSLDKLVLSYMDAIQLGQADADKDWGVGATITVSVKIGLIILGLAPFIIFATLILLIANIGTLIVLTVGPIFFAFLLFPATRQYFSSWLNSLLSYALMPLFVAVIAGISVEIAKAMFEFDNLLNVSFLRVFLCSIGNLLLLLMLREVSSLASSLSAGGINANTNYNPLRAATGGVKQGINSSVAGAKGGYKIYKHFKKRGGSAKEDKPKPG